MAGQATSSPRRGREDADAAEAWRLEQLLEAGYPLPLAERIAASRADLHEAVELVAVRGCPAATAAAILL